MGYESRIFVVDYHKNTNWGEVLCMMNLCKMGYGNGFHDLFKNRVDYDVFLEAGDEPTTRDNYDEPLKDAPVDEVIKWFEQKIKNDDFRRLKPCLAMLGSFDPSKWADLRVIHYGY